MERHLYHRQETMSPEQHFLTTTAINNGIIVGGDNNPIILSAMTKIITTTATTASTAMTSPTTTTTATRTLSLPITNLLYQNNDVEINHSKNTIIKNTSNTSIPITTITTTAPTSTTNTSIETTSVTVTNLNASIPASTKCISGISDINIRKSIINSNTKLHPPDVETALSSMLWTPYERTPTDTSSSSDEDEQQPQQQTQSTFHTISTHDLQHQQQLQSNLHQNHHHQQQQQQLQQHQTTLQQHQMLRKSKSCHDAILFSSTLGQPLQYLNFIYNNQCYNNSSTTIGLLSNEQEQQSQLYTINATATQQQQQQLNQPQNSKSNALNHHNVPSIYNNRNTNVKSITFDSIQQQQNNSSNISNNSNNNNNFNINNSNSNIQTNNIQSITVNNNSNNINSNRFSYPCYGYIPSVVQHQQYQQQQQQNREPPPYESLYQTDTITTALDNNQQHYYNNDYNQQQQNHNQITYAEDEFQQQLNNESNSCNNEVDNSNANTGLTVLFGTKRKPVVISNLIQQTLSAAKNRNKNNRNRQEARNNYEQQQQQEQQLHERVQQNNYCDNSNNNNNNASVLHIETRAVTPTPLTPETTAVTMITTHGISETGMMRGKMPHSITADSFITHQIKNKHEEQQKYSLPIILQSNNIHFNNSPQKQINFSKSNFLTNNNSHNDNDSMLETKIPITNVNTTSLSKTFTRHANSNVSPTNNIKEIASSSHQTENEINMNGKYNNFSISETNNYENDSDNDDQNDYLAIKENFVYENIKGIKEKSTQFHKTNVNTLRNYNSDITVQLINTNHNENINNNKCNVNKIQNQSRNDPNLQVSQHQSKQQQKELQYQLNNFNIANDSYKIFSGDSEVSEEEKTNIYAKTKTKHNNDESQLQRECLEKQQLQNIYENYNKLLQQKDITIENQNTLATIKLNHNKHVLTSTISDKIAKNNDSRNEQKTNHNEKESLLQCKLQKEKPQNSNNKNEETKPEKRKVSKPICSQSNNMKSNGNDRNDFSYTNESLKTTIISSATSKTKAREIILSPEQYFESVERRTLNKNRGNSATNVATSTLATPQMYDYNCSTIFVERASQTDLTVSTRRDFKTDGPKNVELTRVSSNLQQQLELINEFDTVKRNRGNNILSIETVRDLSSSLKILFNQSQQIKRFFGKNKNRLLQSTETSIGAYNTHHNDNCDSTLNRNYYDNYSSSQNSSLAHNSNIKNINNDSGFNNSVISSIPYLRSIEFQFGESNIRNSFQFNTNCNTNSGNSSSSSSSNSGSSGNSYNNNIINQNLFIKNYESDDSDDDEECDFNDNKRNNLNKSCVRFNDEQNSFTKTSRVLLDQTTMRLNIPASNPLITTSSDSGFDNSNHNLTAGIINGFNTQTSIGINNLSSSNLLSTTNELNRNTIEPQIDNVGVSSSTTLGLQVNQQPISQGINNFNNNINNSNCTTTNLFLPNISNNSTKIAPTLINNGAIYSSNTTTPSSTQLSTVASTEPSLTIQVNQVAGINTILQTNVREPPQIFGASNNQILSNFNNLPIKKLPLPSDNIIKNNCSLTTIINSGTTISQNVATGSNITSIPSNSGISVVNCYSNNSSSVPNSISNINSVNNLNNKNISNSSCQINSICAISGSDNNNYIGSGINSYNNNTNNSSNNQLSKNSDVNIVQNHNVLSKNLNTATASTSTNIDNVNNVIAKSSSTSSHNSNNNDNLNDLNKNSIINISHNAIKNLNNDINNKSETKIGVLNNSNINDDKINANEQNGSFLSTNTTTTTAHNIIQDQQHRPVQRTFTSTECQTDDIPLDNIISAAAASTNTNTTQAVTTPSRKKSSGNRNINATSQIQTPIFNNIGVNNGIGINPNQTDALIAREQRRRERRERRRNNHMHHPPPHMLQPPPNHPPPHPPPMHYGPPGGGVPGGIGPPGNPNLIRPMLPDILHSHFPPPYGALSIPPPPHHPTSPPPPPPGPIMPPQPPPHFNPGGPPPPQSMITTPIISAVPMAAASTVVNDGRFTIPLPVIRR
ncbi:probable cyclin-dependent serine/threonine-protein kinase DDB_G0292550 [Condylostylus longicornis]|uniref:probable cyclin-dependent serine/threonine-protein kinase DDB_G0292550 n=1 Tax=Condylostylus longicornis TaxID=2530218 RepID=UPI00244DC74B|nr:probable cyclin-dependent serine/threonine-protein kinase DDB_G0292550 [Condylostylus longicornis]